MGRPSHDRSPGWTDLRVEELHGSLVDPVLDSMTFLNEVAERFPDAISFAPGRPAEDHFAVADLHGYLSAFCDYLRTRRGCDDAGVRRALFQYGPTKGIIAELVARNLVRDAGIEADPASIVVTAGCQEAILLVLRALRGDDRDVILAAEPTYVGLLGAARIVDLPVVPVRDSGAGIDPADLVAQVRRARAAGLRPRACYVMADCANPSGASLDLAARHALLRVADEEGLLLLEDNAYGLFREDADGPPTLKSLDRRGRVVYLGSFAKSGFPGARVGFAVADQTVSDGGRALGLFADQLAKIKSMTTVNTSAIGQAVVGGMLVGNDCDLRTANAGARAAYRSKLRRTLDALAGQFARVGGAPPGADAGVRWNAPRGGFFIVVTVPFAVGDALLERSAREFGVLWTPMHHFYAGTAGVPALRLSCSAVSLAEIDEGIDRLARFIRDQANEAARPASGPFALTDTSVESS